MIAEPTRFGVKLSLEEPSAIVCVIAPIRAPDPNAARTFSSFTELFKLPTPSDPSSVVDPPNDSLTPLTTGPIAESNPLIIVLIFCPKISPTNSSVEHNGSGE